MGKKKETAEKLTIPEYAKKAFSNTYGFVGNHSGVQVCLWNRKALRGKGVCYKQKFYGIDCHRCAQMTPSLVWCQENCIFCWRPMEWMKKTEMKESEVDGPAEIIAGVVEQRRRLLSGIGGAADANRKLWKEAFEKFPSHWAISLSGEATIYPKLPELIGMLRTNSEVRSVFLVTNGQEPKMLEKLVKERALPTQLYISVDAPDSELFTKVNRSLYKDGWERLNRSLGIMSGLAGKCNRVIRFTLIKGLNDDEGQLAKYATLFRKSGADFIEIKAYMFLGHSRKRLKQENMPDHEYVVEWSRKLAAHLPDYEKKNEDAASRIVLFSKAV